MIKSSLKLQIKETLNEIAKKTSLMWSGIVGSFIKKETIPKDIDILLIYNILTKEEYRLTINYFTKLAKKVSDGKKFIVEERNGPFKPTKQEAIQFHLIIQSKEFFEYTAQKASLSYIEWTVNNILLYGPPILSIFKDKRPITKKMLMNTEFGGINSSINSLEHEEIYYAIYKVKDKILELSIETKQPTNKEMRNFLISIIKANLMNFTKWKTRNYSPSYRDIIGVSRKELPSYSNEIEEIYDKETITKNQVKNILTALKEKVENSTE